MNKTDLENLNGYLFNTFNGYLFNTFNSVVKLDVKFNIEICYTTRMNTKLEKMIIIKSNFKKSYLKFCDYLLTSDVVNEIISILYQFYLKELIEQNN